MLTWLLSCLLRVEFSLAESLLRDGRLSNTLKAREAYHVSLRVRLRANPRLQGAGVCSPATTLFVRKMLTTSFVFPFITAFFEFSADVLSAHQQKPLVVLIHFRFEQDYFHCSLLRNCIFKMHTAHVTCKREHVLYRGPDHAQFVSERACNVVRGLFYHVFFLKNFSLSFIRGFGYRLSASFRISATRSARLCLIHSKHVVRIHDTRRDDILDALLMVSTHEVPRLQGHRRNVDFSSSRRSFLDRSLAIPAHLQRAHCSRRQADRNSQP